jgi:hypothetical protein
MTRLATGVSSALFVLVLVASRADAQTIAPPFDTSYSLVSLGSVPGVPTAYGGLTLSATDANRLLVGGAANGPSGALYEIQVVRNQCGNITGFTGTASLMSTAPGVDGGVAYGPNNVLFVTGYSANILHQIKPGSSMPDLTTNLTPLGVSSSVGSVAFVPSEYANAGEMKIASYSASTFYSVPLTPDANGTFTLGTATQTAQLTGGLEGIAYVPAGSPGFTVPSILIAEYVTGTISVYDTTPAGDPIPTTRRPFLTGLSGAEGAFIDPRTGDFLFSTFGGASQVIRVSGFAARCDPIDFNADGVFPDSTDIEDFLSVYSGGSCSNDPHCGDVDFNNDCVSPDSSDIEAFLRVYGGGNC